MNSANNYFNKEKKNNNVKGNTKNFEYINKRLSPTFNKKIALYKYSNNNSNNKSKILYNISCDNYNEKEKYEKIIYIQKWWKIMNKIILIQKNIKVFLGRKKIMKVIYLIKVIYNIYLKKFIFAIKEKGKSLNIDKNQKYLNKLNNNLKVNIIKKLKKYETSTKFNKRNRLKNNSLLNNSSTNKHILMKKIEYNKKTRNDNTKSIYTNNTYISLNTSKINKENTKYILSNDDNIIKNKSKNYIIKEAKPIINNISNKEKLKAYNNIFNLYNNIKKIYENNNKDICETNYITTNNANKKLCSFKFDKNKKKEKIKAKKNNIKDFPMRRKRIKSTNNNIINKLKKYFIYWKEFSYKMNILKKLKNDFYKKSDLFLIKNRMRDKKRKKEALSITTKKINLSNSIINKRLRTITPKQLNQMNNDNKINQNIIDKINKENYYLNKNIYKRNNNKKYYSNNNILLDNNKRNYNLFLILKILEKYNNKKKIEKYFNKWKLLIKVNNTNIIKEKIINFNTVKPPFKKLKNSALNILCKRRNCIYQRNSSHDFLYETESNMNYLNSHIRNNSIMIQRDSLSPLYLPQEISNKDYIYKSNMLTKKIIYKKKLLKDKRMRNKYVNMNEERNLTLDNNSRVLKNFNQTEGNFFKYKERRNKMNNSIYGGKFFDNSFRNTYKGNNKIEERIICFTPNKNSTFRNTFGINVKVIENYLNNNNDNCDNSGIKTKHIILNDKNNELKYDIFS